MYQMFACNFYSFFVVRFLSDKTSKRFSFEYIKQKQFYIFVYYKVPFPSNIIKFMKAELTFRDHEFLQPIRAAGAGYYMAVLQSYHKGVYFGQDSM